MVEKIFTVYATVNYGEDKETDVKFSHTVSLDSVLEDIKKMYPDVSSVVLTFSL